MRDFNSILLLNSLRVALNSLEQNPELAERFSGVDQLSDRLRDEIERLEPRVQEVIKRMPEPSVGVPA